MVTFWSWFTPATVKIAGLVADAALCGIGVVTTVKSAMLESVSSIPAPLRTAPVVLESTPTAVVSEQFAVPNATLSTSVPTASAPHATLAFTARNKPTLPLVALKAIVKLKSATTGSAAPPVEGTPLASSK